MKKILFFILLVSSWHAGVSQENTAVKIADQTIFVYGGDINLKFTQYVVDLTKKSNPKICYVPTASADNESNIKLWNFYCKKLNIEACVLKVWVASSEKNKSFEDQLLGKDAIVVGGGNTLNMLGIWKAQGIDTILHKALEKGIILSGGSAGSICWFQSGISDSRPTHLSVIDGLSFLPFSNCPHYSDSIKKQVYHKQIKSQTINSGYACDDRSGILFKNGKYIETVSLNDVNNSYFVALNKGTVQSSKLPTRILVNKDALSVSDYKTIEVNKAVSKYAEINNQDSPINAFISFKYIAAKGRQSKFRELSSFAQQNKMNEDTPDKTVDEKTQNKHLHTIVNKIFIYNDSLAGVVNRMYDDYYGLWYFFKEDGKWMSAGEDIGDTELECEIVFREKAKMRAKSIKK
ncbi:MAG: peptidase E [Marinifilaceae bacterium]|nr:peptidase E [Marinifilaceae bacterium]